MLPMGVAEWCPLPIGFVDETASPFVDGKVLAKSEIGLEIPIRVLVDLTALTSVQ